MQVAHVRHTICRYTHTGIQYASMPRHAYNMQIAHIQTHNVQVTHVQAYNMLVAHIQSYNIQVAHVQAYKLQVARTERQLTYLGLYLTNCIIILGIVNINKIN